MHVFVHIGYPKTGSSAIQSHIFANQGWFEQRGIVIPQTGYSGGMGHSLLATQTFVNNQSDTLPDSVRRRFSRLEEELESHAATGYETALISSEGLAMVDETCVRLLAAALRNHEVTLLMYVRDQVKLFQSAMLQHMETPRVGYQQLLFQEGRVRAPAEATRLANYDYSECVARWQRAFDSGLTVRVRQYERRLLSESDVVVDFLEWLNLAPDGEFALQSGSVNASIDSASAALLLVAQQVGMNRGALRRLRRALISVEVKAGSTGTEFLSESDKSFLQDTFRESNARLFRKFRPENAPPDALGFSNSDWNARDTSGGKLDFDFLREVHRKLAQPVVPVWEGEILTGHLLEDVTRGESFGWHTTEADGVWNSDKQAVLSFRLPLTSKSSGPRGLQLYLSGVYSAGPSQTRVTVGAEEGVFDLRDAWVNCTIDERARTEGMRIVLEFGTKSDKAQREDSSSRTFKLQRMLYRFIWSPAEPGDQVQ